MRRLLFREAIAVAAMSFAVVSCGGGDEGAASDAPESASATGPQSEARDGQANNATSSSGPHSGNVADLIASFADIDADILGVRLGMTPQEAHAALKEARPDAAVSLPNYISMTSQGQQVAPDAPGAYIQGVNINDPRDKVIVTSASPPSDNVVTAIERSQFFSAPSEKTSLEVFRNALIEKYGEPDEAPVWNNLLYHFKWLYPSSAKDCNPLDTSLPATHYKNWRTDAQNMRHPPEQCAAALIYTLTVNNGVVDRANVKIGNPGAIRLAQEAHIALREELAEQAADAARAAATNEPDL